MNPWIHCRRCQDCLLTITLLQDRRLKQINKCIILKLPSFIRLIDTILITIINHDKTLQNQRINEKVMQFVIFNYWFDLMTLDDVALRINLIENGRKMVAM